MNLLLPTSFGLNQLPSNNEVLELMEDIFVDTSYELLRLIYGAQLTQPGLHKDFVSASWYRRTACFQGLATAT